MLAWIIPINDSLPPTGGGGQPPSIWPGPHPSNPIMLPGMPGWGSGGGQPPFPSTGPGFPTNPIAEPPWGWGGQPGGGQPPRPSTGPGFPTNPIAEPPWGWGQQPPSVWPGPHPSHPIMLPGMPGWPQPPVPEPPTGGLQPPVGFEWKYGYSPATGQWGFMLVGTGEKPLPEPTPPQPAPTTPPAPPPVGGAPVKK